MSEFTKILKVSPLGDGKIWILPEELEVTIQVEGVASRRVPSG